MDESTPLGTLVHRDDDTVVKRVLVVGGRGVWAYYRHPESDSRHEVIADIFYNPHASRFAGQLDLIYSASGPAERWLTISGFHAPAREVRKYVEDEDYGLPRMEHRS